MSPVSAFVSRNRGLPFALIVLSAQLACAGASQAKRAVPATAPVAAAPPSLPPDAIELVFVKGGCFGMGNASEGGPEEKPVHEVCVDDFYMGKYEVTRAEWQGVMGSPAPTSNPACDDRCPAEMVSWDDAQAFVARLNATRRGAGTPNGEYRLPTEAEWEYAARSGGKDELYAGHGSAVDDLGWHFWNAEGTQEVGLKDPNGLGLHDMSGNVWEWTGDRWGEAYYAESPRMNPAGPAAGDHRVLRGGSAGCPPFDLRTRYRNHLPPDHRGAGKGLRVVMTAATPTTPAATVQPAPAATAPPADVSARERPRPAPSSRDPNAGMEFVQVEAGCFRMGDLYGDFRSGDSQEPDRPVHEVCLDGFSIGKYEVTIGQWRAVMATNPSNHGCKRDDCPVDSVTYRDVQEFIGRLNAKAAGAQTYRLPTEAEWEYAARSGGRVERYSGGNDVQSVSWYRCKGVAEDCVHPVGSHAPNGLGIHDMSGNVYEITSDWLSPTYYATSPRENPRGPDSGTRRVKRGGCANGGPGNSRVARRTSFSDPNAMTGFRLVRIP